MLIFQMRAKWSTSAATSPAMVYSFAMILTLSPTSRAVCAVMGPMQAMSGFGKIMSCPTSVTKLRTVEELVKVIASTPRRNSASPLGVECSGQGTVSGNVVNNRTPLSEFKRQCFTRNVGAGQENPFIFSHRRSFQGSLLLHIHRGSIRHARRSSVMRVRWWDRWRRPSYVVRVDDYPPLRWSNVSKMR